MIKLVKRLLCALNRHDFGPWQAADPAYLVYGISEVRACRACGWEDRR